MLHTGIQWEYLPQELGFGSGMTCWRRLAAWNEAGVWDELHLVLLEKLRLEEPAGLVAGGDRLLPRPGRPAGPKSGPSPVDRARPGSKHHLITDGQGIPLAVSLTGGNRNDVTQLLPLLDKIPAVAGVVGRPRRRPDALLADRGYDHDKYRRLLWAARHPPGHRPNEASRTAPAWASSAGWSSARSPGCTASAACGSAGNDATTSTKPSSASPPA